MKNTRLAQARLGACRRWPAATSAILSLIPVERKGLGTLAVDKHWRLYFDPEYLASVKEEEATSIILHEVAHLLLKHHARGGNATDWDLWNQAADLAVNHRLIVEGHPLPPGALTPPQFQLPGNLSAEQYYRHLEDRKHVEQQQAEEGPESEPAAESGPPEEPEDPGSEDPAGDGTDEGQDGQPSAEAAEQDAPEGAGGEGSDAGDSPGPGDVGDPQGIGDGSSGSSGEGDQDAGCGLAEEADGEPLRGRVEPGTSGSCADGQLKPWEDPPPEAKADGEPEGTPAIEPHEQEQLIRKVAEAIEQKSRGSGSGGWSDFVQQILHPKVDPRVLLSQAIRQAVDQISGGHDDTSYRRPSRRPSVGGVIRPSRVALIPRICLIIDTSGSMDRRDLGLALGMVSKVLSGFRLRDGVQVMCGDTRVQSCEKVFDPKKIDLKGRGGTDMRLLIEEAAKLEPQPQLIVLISDGETGYPARPVGVPVVACLTRESSWCVVPDWIKSIVLA